MRRDQIENIDEMTIVIHYDDHIVNGADESVDIDASFIAYERCVEKAVSEAYPHADIYVVGPAPYLGHGIQTREWIEIDDDEWVWDENYATTDHVLNIVERVFERGEWVVEKGR